MIIYILAVVSVCNVIVADIVEVRECQPIDGVQVPKPAIVDIEDCQTPPCILKRGKNTDVSFTVSPENDIQQSSLVVIGKTMGMAKGYPGLDGSNACNIVYQMPEKTKINCPLQKDKEVMFKFSMPIKKVFPQVSLVMHSGIKDKATKKVITCFEVDMKIV
ncbi:hypothetical protein PGB90_004640 [Kerria lacca]